MRVTARDAEPAAKRRRTSQQYYDSNARATSIATSVSMPTSIFASLPDAASRLVSLVGASQRVEEKSSATLSGSSSSGNVSPSSSENGKHPQGGRAKGTKNRSKLFRPVPPKKKRDWHKATHGPPAEALCRRIVKAQVDSNPAPNSKASKKEQGKVRYVLLQLCEDRTAPRTKRGRRPKDELARETRLRIVGSSAVEAAHVIDYARRALFGKYGKSAVQKKSMR